MTPCACCGYLAILTSKGGCSSSCYRTSAGVPLASNSPMGICLTWRAWHDLVFSLVVVHFRQAREPDDNSFRLDVTIPPKDRLMSSGEASSANEKGALHLVKRFIPTYNTGSYLFTPCGAGAAKTPLASFES